MKKTLKRILLFLLVALLVFVGVVLINTFRFGSRQITATPVPPIPVPTQAVTHFAQALRFQTVSSEDPAAVDSAEFRGFAAFLQETYPLCDSLLDKQTFNEFSFLYHWKGEAPELKPILLIAHLDVVPVLPENLPDWREAPFAGTIARDTVWGRGAIDDKNVVIAVMEALELMLREGYQPRRGIYMAVVHDEEVGGQMGAKAIAAHLRAQGVKAEYILDEGGVVSHRIVPGIEKELALVGVAEKGFLSLNMEVKIEGGHSSMPNKETAVDVMAQAVRKLKENPFPAKISPAIAGFINYVGPELPFLKKAIFANSGIFGSLILNVYKKKASGNALVRTTTAPTLFHAGVKDNVLPQMASATVNFRILSGESIASVLERVQTVVDDPRISMTVADFNSEPSAISSIENQAFKTLHQTIAEVYPGMLVSPYMMVGATDSRHFSDLTEGIYRFSPIRINPENVKSFHGLNECLPVVDFENSIRFYVQLLKNSTRGPA